LGTPAEELVVNGDQIWLMPHEMIYCPFKYQAWQHGQVQLSVAHADRLNETSDHAASAIEQRSILVSFSNVQLETITCIEVQVQPQPFVIDQCFRFHQSENEFLKTTIRLHQTRWHSTNAATHLARLHTQSSSLSAVSSRNATSAQQPVWVRTSDPDVLAGVHEQRSPTDPIEVSIKYRCTASPSVSRFLVLVYSDVWLHQLLETWEIVVHSLQRIDIHALVGQTSIAKAILRGAAHGPVQCFSSSPNELTLSPAMPITLVPSMVQEIVLNLRPIKAGRMQYIVHAVDLSRRALLSSWLIHTITQFPTITKAFSLTIDPVAGAHKKISFANPYSYDATFHAFTDQPHLMRFKHSFLHIPAGETQFIQVQFLPLCTNRLVTSTRLLIFVNNEDDKNEECLDLIVHHSIPA